MAEDTNPKRSLAPPPTTGRPLTPIGEVFHTALSSPLPSPSHLSKTQAPSAGHVLLQGQAASIVHIEQQQPSPSPGASHPSPIACASDAEPALPFELSEEERLGHIWQALRNTLWQPAPRTSVEFAEQAESLWSIIVLGLEVGVKPKEPQEESRAARSRNRERRGVIRSAALAATKADIDEQSERFAEAAEEIRRLIPPQELEREQ